MDEAPKTKEKFIAWKIDKAKDTYEYCFNSDGDGRFIAKLIFKNTTKKPTSLNNNGYGFSRALKPFSRLLKGSFKKIDGIVVANHKSEIKRNIIHFNKSDYELMVNSLNTVYRENSNRLEDFTFREMSAIFPKKFKSKDKPATYTAGTISRLLSKKGAADQLSDDDIAKVVEIIPSLMDRSIKAKAGVLSKIQFSSIQSKSASYQLKKIIDEYESLLRKKSQKESEWQDFLKKNILFINSSYIKLIDKKNIGISVSIPDFLLIDQFEYVDVFEIKKPDMKCLAHDASHDNYYWSTDASKAIAQVEKYLFLLQRNALAIVDDLRKQRLDVNLIKPRGYVLIGKRSALDENEQNSFKILNESLKNVQVLFFDDLLTSLKNKYTVIKKK